MGSVSSLLCLSRGSQRYLKGVNVALAFCMGSDLQNIVDNPIGQPMATVERCQREYFFEFATDKMTDPVQLVRAKRNTDHLVFHYSPTVRCHTKNIN